MGYRSNSKIYKQALTHKSYNNKEHNEQLEFLGDAVLSSIIAERLFLENPNKSEGFLSKKRALIVSRKHLNLIGKKIIPKTQIKSRLNPIPESVFGNVLEAIIGAIYIDKGLQKTTKFIKKHIYKSSEITTQKETDFKTKLLNYSRKKKEIIKFKTEAIIGPPHNKKYIVAVFVNETKTSEASAFSKKAAEKLAAEKALKILEKQ